MPIQQHTHMQLFLSCFDIACREKYSSNLGLSIRWELYNGLEYDEGLENHHKDAGAIMFTDCML